MSNKKLIVVKSSDQMSSRLCCLPTWPWCQVASWWCPHS